MALAAMGWADGALKPNEAKALLHAAKACGLEGDELQAVERATRETVTLDQVDVEGLTQWERVLTYALASWVGRLDGVLSSDEHENLKQLGNKLDVAEPLRVRASSAAFDVALLPEGGRPEKYDFAKLEARLREKLPQLAIAEKKLGEAGAQGRGTRVRSTIEPAHPSTRGNTGHTFRLLAPAPPRDRIRRAARQHRRDRVGIRVHRGLCVGAARAEPRAERRRGRQPGRVGAPRREDGRGRVGGVQDGRAEAHVGWRRAPLAPAARREPGAAGPRAGQGSAARRAGGLAGAGARLAGALVDDAGQPRAGHDRPRRRAAGRAARVRRGLRRGAGAGPLTAGNTPGPARRW
jgi:hypothetical protein